MLIACEKCATTYVLDERLIPAAGAPVQCTRCGHVFTAKPGGVVPTAITPAKAADKPANQTMMFGAAGTAAAPPAAAPANRTMMFGAAGEAAPPAPAPAANRTMMFGAAGAGAPPAPAPPANRTMMFGAADAGAAPKSSTMMFGAVPPAAPAQAPAAAPVNQTMVFGKAAAVPTPVITRPTSQTMVFGTAAAPRPGDATPPPSTANRTMMFGIPTADKPNVEPAGPARNTMMFGTPAADQAPGKIPEKTVRIGPEELEQMMRDHAAKSSRASETTPPEGAPAGAGASQRTQMFAMSDIRPPEPATPVEGTQAVQARHDRTAMFAMSAPGAVAPAEPPKSDPSPQPDPPLRSTMIFGAGQGTPGRPPLLAPVEQPDRPQLVSSTMLNLPSLPREQALAFKTVADGPAGATDDPSWLLAEQVRRRNRLALIIVGVAILIAVGAVGWKVVGAKLFTKSVPLEAMQAVESGLAELRKDDTASKAVAVKQLLAVVQSQPTFVDAHAGLVTALTLQLDDLQQRAKRLDKAAEERNARISRYGKEKTPADWESRAAALIGEVTAIKKEYDPLVASARELEARLRLAYTAMQAAAAAQGGELNRQAELALIRAQALYHAYGGTDEALKLTKRYQSKSEGQSDGWIDLVDAEYAANTRASPDLVEAAQKQLTALHERDPAFFRTYVLAARLKLQAKLYDEAEAELQTVSALKPKHDIANELTEWVKKVKAEKAAKEKDKAGQ